VTRPARSRVGIYRSDVKDHGFLRSTSSCSRKRPRVAANQLGRFKNWQTGRLVEELDDLARLLSAIPELSQGGNY